MSTSAAIALVTGAVALGAACNDGEQPRPRASGDVFVYDAGPGAARAGDGPTEQYAFLAVRSLSAVGLAEARGIDDAEARAIVSRLADALEACVIDLGARHQLTQGAARVVAVIGADGVVTGAKVTPDPDTAPVLATAKLCLEARVKLAAFPPSTGAGADKRGLAIEALWGTLMPKPKETR